MKLAELARQVGTRGLRCLLIGGHAVVAHGHPRTTFDLDLVVPRSSLENWRAFAIGAGYTLHGEGPAFVQFNTAAAGGFPLDLMIVSDETFLRLDRASMSVPEPALELRMVCLEHLLAMKAHSIRHGHPGRVEKDVDDVIGLVRANKCDVTQTPWRELFLRHGPPELHEKLLRARETGES
jgi:hypothetical protein